MRWLVLSIGILFKLGTLQAKFTVLFCNNRWILVAWGHSVPDRVFIPTINYCYMIIKYGSSGYMCVDGLFPVRMAYEKLPII